jgi:hypothetical protein
MARSKALIAAEQRIAALEARLSVATQVFKDQRATIRELEAKLNTRGVVATATESVAPIVTRYTKADGSVWEKTRVGNRASSHQVN